MTKELIVILDKIEQAKADCLKGAIITMKSIAEEINKSEATAGKYLNALAECKFADGFKINKERKYIVDKGGSGKDNIVCVGTYIEAVYE